MKRMKRVLVLMLSAVMLIGMMTPIAAYAKSNNELVITIPSRNYSTTYDAYDELSKAEENKVILELNQDEFPVYATLYSSNGAKEEYEFNSYGTQRLEKDNISAGRDILYGITFVIGGAYWIPKPTVHAVIEITPPQQEEPKVESTEESKVESAQKPEEPEEKFDILIDKIKGMSNYPLDYIYEEHIKDYASGKWDGTMDYSYDGRCYGSIRHRTYQWTGIEPYTGKCYNDIEVNIDYVGPLNIVTNRYYTLATNYDTGEIEQWVLLEKKDSWKLQLAEGETIDSVYASYEIHEDEIQGYVFTNDLEGNTHMYWLFPNKKVKKAS